MLSQEERELIIQTQHQTERDFSWKQSKCRKENIIITSVIFFSLTKTVYVIISLRKKERREKHRNRFEPIDKNTRCKLLNGNMKSCGLKKMTIFCRYDGLSKSSRLKKSWLTTTGSWAALAVGGQAFSYTSPSARRRWRTEKMILQHWAT